MSKDTIVVVQECGCIITIAHDADGVLTRFDDESHCSMREDVKRYRAFENIVDDAAGDVAFAQRN